MTTDEMLQEAKAKFDLEPGRREVRITMDYHKVTASVAEAKAAELQAQLARAFPGYGCAREYTGRLVTFIITRP